MTTPRPAVPFHTRLYYRIVQSGRYVDSDYSGNIFMYLMGAVVVSLLILIPFSVWRTYEGGGQDVTLADAVKNFSIVFVPCLIFIAALAVGALYRRRIKSDADLLHYVLPYTYLNSHPEIDRAAYKDAWVRVPLPLERKALLMQALIPLDQAVHNSISDDDLTLMAALAGDYQQIPQWIEYEEVGW